jgi:hypothetical protein
MTLQAISPPKRVGCEKMNTDLAKKKSLTLSHQGFLSRVSAESLCRVK